MSTDEHEPTRSSPIEEPQEPRGRAAKGGRGSGRARRGRPQTQPITPDTLAKAALPLTEPRHWLTQDWRLRRAVRLHRLGEWVAMTRARLQLTSRELERLALRDGEPASSTLFLRVEHLRLADQVSPEEARERVSITAIDWLATLAGQTLADVDRYLRGGDLADLEPDVATRGDAVRSAYLSLSSARRQALEDFAQHLYHLDELEQRAIVFPAASPPLPPTARPTPLGAVSDADVPADVPADTDAGADPRVAGQAAQAEVRATFAELERARERVRELEQQQEGSQGSSAPKRRRAQGGRDQRATGQSDPPDTQPRRRSSWS